MFAFLAAGDDGTSWPRATRWASSPSTGPHRDGAVRFASEMPAFDADWLPHVEAFPPASGLPTAASSASPAPCRGEPARGAPSPRGDFEETRDRSSARCAASSWATCRWACSSRAASTRRWWRPSPPAELPEGERLKTFAVGTEGPSDLVAARQAASSWVPSTTSACTRREEAGRARTWCARSSTSTHRWCAAPCQLPAGRDDRPAREGGAHRRGRRRAVRGLRVPARAGRPGSCTTRSCARSRAFTT